LGRFLILGQQNFSHGTCIVSRAITHIVRKGEAHTLDEGLGEGAGSVTVTVSCSDETWAIVCVVMTVNTGGVEVGASTFEDIWDDSEGPGKVCMLGDSVVRGLLTEVSGVFEDFAAGRADDWADVPDGDRMS
jgi:hypothetical protein